VTTMQAPTGHPFIAKVRDIYEGFLSFFFPPLCLSCDERLLVGDEVFCDTCRSCFEFISHPYCELCGAPVTGKLHEEGCCSNCPAPPVHFTRARAALLYQGAVAEGVIAFKFMRRVEVGELLARILFVFLKNEMGDVTFDGIVPVPLHFWRFHKRGYNQAEVMGKVLSDLMNIPLLPEALRRRRATKPQSRLAHSERMANVGDAFEIAFAQPIRGAHVLLLDDVYTTGSTLNACAKVLKDAGAREVTALTACRAISG